jgi:hypothetical protein
MAIGFWNVLRRTQARIGYVNILLLNNSLNNSL